MNNKYITGIIGIGAFIIGGLMARQTTIEGIELLDEKIKARFSDEEEPETIAE